MDGCTSGPPLLLIREWGVEGVEHVVMVEEVERWDVGVDEEVAIAEWVLGVLEGVA